MTGLSAEASAGGRGAADSAAEALDTLAKNGKSFHWASRLLGRRMAADAAELYSFCRLLDDIADGDADGGKDRLSAIRNQLLILNDRAMPEEVDPALARYLSVMRRCAIPVMPMIHLLDGLLLDQSPMLVEDEERAGEICPLSCAGAVGLLMCPVLGCRDRAALLAVDMGIAMQLTNVRGIFWKMRIWAGAICRKAGAGPLTRKLSAGQLTLAAASYQAVQAAADGLLMLADRYYESRSPRPGLGYLPFRARIGIAVAGRVYRRIGVRLRARRQPACAGATARVVTSTSEKLLASLRALSGFAAHPAAEHNGKRFVHNQNLHRPSLNSMAEAMR